MVHPWPAEGQPVCLELGPEGKAQPVQVLTEEVGPDQTLSWDTARGRRYLLLRHQDDLEAWKITKEIPERRLAPRTLKQATLGRERLY